ncbi:MAG: FAD-binding oxidoreductase [Dehalococcoidia bacterium]
MSSILSPAASLEPALSDILGGALTSGDASYAVDGLVATFVAAPGSAEQIAAALAAADEHGAAVVPWGAGRHMALGNVPRRYDLALSTTKLDRVVEYEPADLVLTVEAGMTMGQLQALLAEHRQFLPIDAPPEATVGGLLAAGVSGPSRHAYGLPRDWLIGCRVAHVDGTISKGGGRVVKNVAGYDLPKLAIGSLGTLGVIVEATVKVAPLPPRHETAFVTCASLEAAGALVSAADDRGLALRAVAIADVAAASALLNVPFAGAALAGFWLAGPASAVERTRRELGQLGGETQRLDDAASEQWWAQLSEPNVVESAMTLRASLTPTSVVEFMRHLAEIGRELGVSIATVAYPTTGLVLASVAEAPPGELVRIVERARKFAVEAGGTLVITSAPVDVRKRINVWGDPSAGSRPGESATGQAPGSALSLMRRVKEQFDPRGTINPGRFMGGL